MAKASFTAPPAARSGSSRLLYLDGIRGLAALAVALFHYRGYITKLTEALPAFVDIAICYGYLGVNVFFVLSGFVIAHSLGNERYSLPFVGRFVVRRQVRLAPPYWATVVFATFWLAGFHLSRVNFFSLFAHLGYVQGILGYPHALDVFWTLCIEIQLYIAFILFAWIGQGARSAPSSLRCQAVFALTTLASYALAWSPLAEHWGQAWFPFYWYMFALGVWTRWALDSVRARWLLAALLPLLVARSFIFQGPGPAVCAATACVLYAGRRWRWPARVLGAAPFVYLGKISYSFYLLHALVGGTILYWVLRLGPPSLALDAVGAVLALAGSIAISHGLWWAVERPSMIWSRRFAGPRRPASAVAAPALSPASVSLPAPVHVPVPSLPAPVPLSVSSAELSPSSQ